MKILVTGGAGYIGSHVCVELLRAGHEVTILDSLSNSDRHAVASISKAAGKKPTFHRGNVRDEMVVDSILRWGEIEAVIHLAGYKSVPESTENPLAYYENNIGGLTTLLKAMKRNNVYKLIFSSSATVYGKGRWDGHPISEWDAVEPENPYGWTKLMGEQILRDLAGSNSDWNVVVFRYFNPVGADASGLIGECPKNAQNLFPIIGEVAMDKRPCLHIYGDDYPTRDGTAIRDYVHITDIAKAHIKALDLLDKNIGIDIYNLGTGKGYTVLEVIREYENVCGKKIEVDDFPHRSGDVPILRCDPHEAEMWLGWKAEKSLEEMCRDAWNWEQKRMR